MKDLQQRTVGKVNMKISIICDHTVAYGMEDIIKLIPLFHQFILHQQAGLGMYPSLSFTTVDTNEPHDRDDQQCQDRWIKKNKQ